MIISNTQKADYVLMTKEEKMCKLSVARINYIIANINDFEPITYINTTKDDVQYEYVRGA